MQATLPAPPAVILFDPRDLSALRNPFFGLEEVEVGAKLWNRGFDAAYHDHRPRVAPGHLSGRRKAEWLKGWDTGLDARETVEWEAEEARQAEYAGAFSSTPWGDADAHELAEAGTAYASEVRD